VSREQVRERVGAEAAAVRATLARVEKQVHLLGGGAGRALVSDHQPPHAHLERYTLTEDGAYLLDDPPEGHASVFYSGIVPVDPDKAHRTERMDPFLHELVEGDPLIAQAYLNTADSLNRIYPPIDVHDYPPGMDIPAYNFYYLADRAHNPEREVVWTPAYLDPAGAGWIISAIAPVYQQDELQGVVGVDVTLQQLVDDVLDVDLPWGGYAILVDSQGALLALPPDGEADFGVRELTDHAYDQAVLQDTLKPAEYDLFNREQTRELAQVLSSAEHGLAEVDLGGERLVAWERLDGPGWWLVVVVPRDAIFASANDVRTAALRLGAVLVGAVLLFYAAFLIVLYLRVRHQVDLLTGPIEQLRTAVRAIVGGAHDQEPVHSRIIEIDELAGDVLAMGRTLGEQVDQLRSQDQALREAAEREAAARAAAEARTSFLAHVSHEIRTPMNGLVGTLDLMRMDGLDPEQLESIHTARRSADALLGLIDDLLEATRAQRGTFEVEDEPFDLGTLAHDVIALFRPTAEASGVTLLAKVDVGQDWVRGDALRLRQVLTNLVSNALKFTDQGSVALSVERRDDDRVHVAVRDSGIGIPASRLEAIFDAFTQAEASTTRRYGGTGLGLTISAALVERMGGRLDVESQEGVGSVFRFSLPLQAVPAGADALDPSSDDDAAVEDLRVLVAEDNPVNQALIRRMLERLGHRPTIVANGELAVEAALDEDWDVVLLDVHMPVMDGRTAAATIRDDPRTAGVPMLALTASVMAEDVTASLEAGFDQVVAKPITLDGLDRALRRVCAARGVTRSA